MHKIMSVARREYLQAVRSKAFIAGVLITPLIILVVIFAQKMAMEKVDLTERKVAVVDRTGRLLEVLQQRASQRDKNEVYKQEEGQSRQVKPRFTFEPANTQELEGTELELALSDRVRSKEYFAFLILEENLFDARAQELNRALYHTNASTYDALPDWIGRKLADAIRDERFALSGIDQGLVNELNRWPDFQRMGLAKKSADAQVSQAKHTNRFLSHMLPFGIAFLLYMVIMTSCPQLLNNVLEEKMAKISEFLISSVTPFELMMGKLLGSVGVALTLSLLYVGTGIYAADRYDVLQEIPPAMFAWLFFYLIISLFMYGAIFSAIGAACSEIKDAQSLMTPAMMLLIIPMVCIGPMMQAPNGPFAQAISLFPPTAPVPMMLRLAMEPGPQFWELIVSPVATLLFAVLCVWSGGRIFQAGILRQGKAPGYKQLLGWIMGR